MSDKQNLVFGLHESLYGISADFVREICWLPELFSLATAPVDTIGIFNWRSQMVPVMHLDLRFGKSFSGCRITDRVIVVEFQGAHLGIVAHEVFDVQKLAVVPIDLALLQARSTDPIANRNFISGIAQSNEQPVICLDLDRLIREPDVVTDAENPTPVISGADLDFYHRCCPDATVVDRATFATRALQLKTAIVQTQSVSIDRGVLVIQIGTDYIGFPLELIVDVDALDRFAISFVPVAPTYILGQINWRGQILPVVELGSVLQIPALPRQELVVVELKDGTKIGIAVDRIFDVFYLNTDRIEQLPLAKGAGMRTYMSGMTEYADSLMYLVKLQELIEQEFIPVRV